MYLRIFRMLNAENVYKNKRQQGCLAEFHTTEFRRNFTEFFDSVGIKLQNSVKFRRIPLNTEFPKIRIPLEYWTL